MHPTPHPGHAPAPRRRMAGATLTEVSVTLCAAALLMGAAMPDVASGFRSARLTSAANVLLFNLYLARSEAIKRNGRVVLCKSADGLSCAGDGGWEQGLLIFVDGNNNASLDAGEAVLHREPALPGLQVSGNGPVADYVSYGPTGQTRMDSGAFQAGSITICQPSAGSTDARQVVVNAMGRPRVQRTVVASCA